MISLPDLFNLKFKRNKWPLIALFIAVLFSFGSVSILQAQSASNASKLSSQNKEAVQSHNLTLKELGDTEGHTLKTVRANKTYHFTRPKGWKMHGKTAIEVSFQHSPALLEERSSLNVLVNHRILKTIPLSKNNVTAKTLSVPIPTDILKDHNSLEFQVDQHYTYKCEDPFSSELWTTILPETTLHLAYTPQAVKPNLAHFPYPFFETLNYGKTTLGYLTPETNFSDESLEALAVVSTLMGQHVDWREIRPFLAQNKGIESNENLILIGTPEETPAISELADYLPVALDEHQFINPKTNKALDKSYGVLQVIANPSHPDKAILIVSGNTPQAVLQAARLLAQQPSNQILVGNYAIVQEQNKGADHPFRAWKGYIQQLGESSLDQLGLKTQTSRGITALPLFYVIRKMPDIWVPADKNIRVKTFYSYSSQLDPTQSKLEVRLNGTPVASVPLDKHAGENQAELSFDVPGSEFFTYNDLEYKFHLFPKKFDMCNFVTDVHIWGTVHNASTLDVPGRLKAPLPDVGLLNDGAFPFAMYQDLSQVSIIMPEKLKATDLDTLLNVTARLGRISKSRTGINLSVSRPKTLSDEAKTESHLIIIGPSERNSLLDEFKSKTKLLMENEKASLKNDGDSTKPLANLNYTADQGIIEELLSPWNDKKVALLVTGKTAKALKRSSQLFARDPWFNKIESGNLMVVNADGPKSLTFLKRGDARFVRPEDYSPGPKIPSWVWVILGIFTFFGFLSVLRFFFSRPSN